MQNLKLKITGLETEVEELKTKIAIQERRHTNAMADQAVSRPGSPEHARAVKEEGEASSQLWDLRRQLERKTAILGVLIARQKDPRHVVWLAETEAMLKKAAKLRKKIDAGNVKIAAATEVMSDALKAQAKTQNELAEMDPYFDPGGYGRASVTNWYLDRFSFYTGASDSFFSGVGRPELPGSAFSHVSTIISNIRRRREKQAATKFRHAAMEDEE